MRCGVMPTMHSCGWIARSRYATRVWQRCTNCLGWFRRYEKIRVWRRCAANSDCPRPMKSPATRGFRGISRNGVHAMNETATGFLARLKQRKLVQWAIAYVAFAFALLQGVDIVAQRFGWPDQVEKLLILVLAIGFVVVLVLAWYHGERGAQKVSGTEIVILALLLAIGGGLLWRFERATPAMAIPDSVAGATSSGLRVASVPIHAQANPIPAKSIAVLPFVNMSGDAKNDYFSDGITEEILDALAQVPNLKVAARTSAFAFKGKAEDLRKVGEVLDVATVLEGSVQKSGDEVRITAQLI